MIKRPSTLLLDVMNAMPFFDPALDTGQVDRAATFDLSAALSVIEICGVMDKMLQLEVSHSADELIRSRGISEQPFAIQYSPRAITTTQLRSQVYPSTPTLLPISNRSSSYTTSLPKAT